VASVVVTLPCFVGELHLVHWWKTSSRQPKQLERYRVRCPASHKLNDLSISVCQCIVFLEVATWQTIPAGTWTRSFWVFLGAAMMKLQQFVISQPDEVYHRSMVTSQQLMASVETSKLLFIIHFMMSRLAKNV